MNKSISIIIPNYNGAEILPQNLPLVIKVAEKYQAGIIIVDDKSKDNSVEILKRDFPQIKLIEKEKNEGFSSTVNLGVKNAQTELVCLLNSDVILTENCLDPLFAHFDDPLTAGVAMMDISDNEDERFGSLHGRGKFIFHKGFLLHWQLGDKTELKSGITGWVSCGSGMFSRKIWNELGGLDELLNPFYFEDVDYGYRAWKCGFKMYFESRSQVQHIHKKGAIKSNYDEKRIKTISYRNQTQFTWKNLSDVDLKLRHYLNLPLNLASAYKNHDQAFLDGFRQAWARRNEIMLKHQELQSKCKLTDHQVIGMFSNT